MTEIAPNLFVGSRLDYDRLRRTADADTWFVVQAAKEPFHRQALGYTTPEPPPNHPERLVARRGNRLILNLLDAPLEIDIPEAIFSTAIHAVDAARTAGQRVLIHCSQGISRSPTVALLYLAAATDRFPETSWQDACNRFQDSIYPRYNPSRAMRRALQVQWPHRPPPDGP